jgi:hypothetical protein
LGGVFGDRIVSRGVRPARSCDLIPCDFYLWDNLKDEIYITNPHTEEEFRETGNEKKFWKFLGKNFFW